jgi:hypothetical protein
MSVSSRQPVIDMIEFLLDRIEYVATIIFSLGAVLARIISPLLVISVNR